VTLGRSEGRTALVTGGGRGIGAGIAMTLRDHGTRVLTADLNGGDGTFDVTHEGSVTAMRDWALDCLGHLDVLVCAAGVLSVGRVEDLAVDEWDRMMAVNARGPFLCARAFLPHMRARRFGSIVTISSISGKQGDPCLAHYGASKAAAIVFSRALAREVAEDGIRVNCVCPGTVRTPMLEHLCEARGETVDDVARRCQLIPHPQTESQIAHAVLFLCENEAVTGQALNVDGGIVLE
jgi:meso-butanediol dehydrogenase / (S,S)-butanediol dehydrogenase / diacetyl reductase